MEVAVKDPGKRHFYISIVKSVVRLLAGGALIYGMFALCGALIIFAEILGIAEEL